MNPVFPVIGIRWRLNGRHTVRRPRRVFWLGAAGVLVVAVVCLSEGLRTALHAAAGLLSPMVWCEEWFNLTAGLPFRM